MPSIDQTIALLALIAGVGYCIQTISGFGAIVVSVTFGAHLLEISELLLLLLPLSVLQCGYIAIRHRAAIDWPLLIRWIIPVMGTGTALGAAASGIVPGEQLRKALAVLILTLSVFELYRLSKTELDEKPLRPAATAAGIFGAGLMHGLYATGGPLLVYTIGRRVPDKAIFRSTLTVVWLLLNSALITYFAIDDRYTRGDLENIAYLIGPVILGIAIGERLHRALSGRRFRQLIFGMLAVAAVSLLLR